MESQESEARERLLSILTVSYNTRELLRSCLLSVERFAPVPHEVIVIDNASTDGSDEMVAAEFPEHQLIRNKSNRGYGAAINQGASYARGDWLMFLNPDAEVCENAIDQLLEFAKRHPQAGVIGPKLVYPDGRLHPTAGRGPSTLLLLLECSRIHLLLPPSLRSRIFIGVYFAHDKTRTVPMMSGACHLIPRRVWEEIGPLTEDTFCGGDDYDYCLRLREHGYEIWFHPSATMMHHCSVAIKKSWDVWQAEQVFTHNLYVVLESHWPRWRVKLFCFAQTLSYLFEAIRHAIRSRDELDDPDFPYAERLKGRIKLTLSFLVGSQRPIRRFRPATEHRAAVDRRESAAAHAGSGN